MPAKLRSRPIQGGSLGTVLAAPADSIVSGQTTVTTPGTAVPLGNGDLDAGVRIKAFSGNTGDLYVGDSTVDSTGYILSPGEEVFVEISQLSRVWLDAATGSDGASYLGT
jgi:hypothetical protein